MGVDGEKTPEQALEELASIFPSFHEYVLEDALDDDAFIGKLTLHRVIFLFTEFFPSACSASSELQLIKFASWINEAVKGKDDLENAISTCFLEHTRQIGVAKLLSPHLSKLAKQKSRA